MKLYWKFLLLTVEALQLITGNADNMETENNPELQEINKKTYDLRYKGRCCHQNHRISGRTFKYLGYKPKPKNYIYGGQHSRPNSKMFFFGKRNEQNSDELQSYEFKARSQELAKEKKLRQDWENHLDAVEKLYNMNKREEERQKEDTNSNQETKAESQEGDLKTNSQSGTNPKNFEMSDPSMEEIEKRDYSNYFDISKENYRPAFEDRKMFLFGR